MIDHSVAISSNQIEIELVESITTTTALVLLTVRGGGQQTSA